MRWVSITEIWYYLFLDDVATEEVSGLETKTVVAQGQLIHANPSDPVHWGRGGLRISQDRNHALPGDLELPAYKSVVIWCKAFGVLISPATLMAPA